MRAVYAMSTAILIVLLFIDGFLLLRPGRPRR